MKFHSRFSCAALVVLGGLTAAAQVRDRSATTSTPSSAQPASDAATIAAGWNALAAGQHEAAVRSAGRILARAPWNHAATGLRIEALSAMDPLRGLDAYETWLAKRTKEDAGLLEPVPRAVLRQIVGGTDQALRRDAVRLLARAGIPMPAGTTDAADRFTEDAAKAKEGDAAAAKRLQSAATSTSVDPATLADTISSAGAAGTPILIAMLSQPAGPARAAAAAALGRRHAQDARAELQKLMDDPDPFVRNTAAVALAKMADDRAMRVVESLLQSEVPDLRLMAADAFEGRNGPWVAAIRPLLSNRNGVTRVQAARLIAPVDPEAARRTLQDTAEDANPVMRAEAARAMEELSADVPDILDLTQARRLLRDADPAVRLHAAGVILAAARNGA